MPRRPDDLDINDEFDDAESDTRRVVIRLNRDSILLAAAILLFTLAIILTVIFSSLPEQTTEVVPSDGQVGALQTPLPGQVPGSYPPQFAYPGPTMPGGPAPGLFPTPGAAYPPSGPQGIGTPPTLPGGIPGGPQGIGTPPVLPAEPLPTFDPIRPTVDTGGSQLPTIDPSDFDRPTLAPFPTEAPFPTFAPAPRFTPEPEPNAPPTSVPPTPIPPTPLPPTPVPPTPVPTAVPTDTPVPPTPVPVDLLSGDLRWSREQSPIMIERDQQLTAGSTLVIDPGVEVRLGSGVRIFVEGQLVAAGQPGNPVRFVGTGPRWEAIYGQPGSSILIDNAEIRGGGSGGRVIMSQNGELVIKSALITDNGGGIQADSSRVELQQNEISGNDLHYASALNASYSRGGFLILADNRIGGNRQVPGTASVQVAGSSPSDTVNLDIQRNLIQGGTADSPALELLTSGQLKGPLICNTFQNGSVGIALRTTTNQEPGFPLEIRNNVLADQVADGEQPALEHGIGRGATSDIVLDMRDNWWGHESGPYDPERNPAGLGDAVGVNITFQPWLSAWPECAPRP